MKTRIERAALLGTDDLKWKSGFVQCQCEWRKDLGDGFNGYHIDLCPSCCKELETRNQRKVVTGRPNKLLNVSLGSHVYFVISNGIHIQYSKANCTNHTVRTEAQADRL